MLNLARNNEELDLLIHLCCSLTPGIGPTKFSKLKNIFDNPINLLQTDINTLSKVVGDKEARALITNLNSLDLHKLLDSYKKNNITVLSQNSLHYPTRLKEIFNPPICLYVKTNAPMDYFANCLKMNTVLAIVGSRKYTNYGKVATEMIVGELSKHEVTIVSGLALGIDSIAHQSSLKLDVHTCAILGCGVDVIYPNENKYLYESIFCKSS